MNAIQEDTHDHQVGEVVTEHTEADVPHSYDDINTPMIALVGFVGAILTFACIFALQAAYLQYASNLRQSKVVDVRLHEAESILDAQKTKLNNYGWVDRPSETVSMPIDRAMQVVVEQYQSN